MSSTTTELSPAYSASLLSPQNVFRIKLSVYGALGCVFLVQSLYFVLAYVTFDFFGARNSPFFAWLRELSLMMRILYFPLLCGALLSISAGDEKREQLRRLAGIFIVAQLAAGTVLICFQPVGLWGSALLFGPMLQTLLGFVEPYSQAVIVLIPLAWVSAIHIKASIRSCAGSEKVANTMKLSSFVLAGLAISFLYIAAAKIRSGISDQPLAPSILLISIASHVAALTAVFVVLQWMQVLANRFSHPRLVQFALRAVVAWVLLAVVVRKVIFALLSFNEYRANLYAAWFSLVIVLFVAALSLRVRAQRLGTDQVPAAPRRAQGRWLRATFALTAATAIFYLLAIRLAAVDWEHILGSLGALITSSLLLWFFISIHPRPRNYGMPVLVVVSLFAVGALASLPATASDEPLTSELQQYSDFDPSFFAIQQLLKPVVQDEKYAAWYKTLSQHANIRIPVEAPDFPLTQPLKRTASKKPDMFIFVIDALRRDYVSAYNPAVTFTPALAAFAQENLAFKHAYSEYAGTELAVPAILSGMQQINRSFPEPVRRLNHLQDLLNIEGYDCYTSFNPVVAALANSSDHITNLSAGLSTDDQQEFGAITRKLESVILERTNTSRPIFVYSQPANVHTLFVNWHRGQVDVKPHPGFDDRYASAVERVDTSFGEFISFLKRQGLYDNSIVIVTADHGEDLGEMGRQSHVNNLTPEVIRIPLLVHLPDGMKTGLNWDLDDPTSLHDITPSVYYLLGHRDLRRDTMLGRSLFTAAGEQPSPKPDHYFLMSSYLPVFGILSPDEKTLFYVDAVLGRSFYYDLEHDPLAMKTKLTVPIRDHYESAIRDDLEAIDRFYGVTEQQLSHSAHSRQ